MKTGPELIMAERARQVLEEGWTPEHDDGHRDGQLALAAACYAAGEPIFHLVGNYGESAYVFEDPWPWEPQDDKRDWDPVEGTLRRMVGPSRVRELVKAGALIAAEIDRLQRR